MSEENLKEKYEELKREYEKLKKQYESLLIKWNSLPPYVRELHDHISQLYLFTLRNWRPALGQLVGVEWKPTAFYIASIQRVYLPEYGGWKEVMGVQRIEASMVISMTCVTGIREPKQEFAEQTEEAKDLNTAEEE